MKTRHLIAAWLTLAASGLQAGEKAPQFIISFHEEGSAEEGKRFVRTIPINGKDVAFRLQPTLTQENIKKWWPFKSADGISYGAVFWLDDAGDRALQRIGSAMKEQYLVAAVNKVPLDVVRIDNTPADNRLVIWKGIDSVLFPAFDKKFKRSSAPEGDLSGAGAEPTLAGLPAAARTGTDGVLDLAAMDEAEKKAKKAGWKPTKGTTGDPVKDASLGDDFHEPLLPGELGMITGTPAAKPGATVKPKTPAKTAAPEKAQITPLPKQ
jgi:hypothetical protein